MASSTLASFARTFTPLSMALPHALHALALLSTLAPLQAAARLTVGSATPGSCSEARGCYSPADPLILLVVDWTVWDQGLVWAISDAHTGPRPRPPGPAGAWFSDALGLSPADFTVWFPHVNKPALGDPRQSWQLYLRDLKNSYVYALRLDGGERVVPYRTRDLPADPRERLRFWLDLAGWGGRRVIRRPGSRPLSETYAYRQALLRGYRVARRDAPTPPRRDAPAFSRKTASPRRGAVRLPRLEL